MGYEIAEEDEDLIDPMTDQQIDLQGCGRSYLKLALCLADTDRDFTKCQEEIQDLKQCYEDFQKKHGEVSEESSQASSPQRPAQKNYELKPQPKR